MSTPELEVGTFANDPNVPTDPAAIKPIHFESKSKTITYYSKYINNNTGFAFIHPKSNKDKIDGYIIYGHIENNKYYIKCDKIKSIKFENDFWTIYNNNGEFFQYMSSANEIFKHFNAKGIVTHIFGIQLNLKIWNSLIINYTQHYKNRYTVPENFVTQTGGNGIARSGTIIIIFNDNVGFSMSYIIGLLGNYYILNIKLYANTGFFKKQEGVYVNGKIIYNPLISYTITQHIPKIRNITFQIYLGFKNNDILPEEFTKKFNFEIIDNPFKKPRDNNFVIYITGTETDPSKQHIKNFLIEYDVKDKNFCMILLKSYQLGGITNYFSPINAPQYAPQGTQYIDQEILKLIKVNLDKHITIIFDFDCTLAYSSYNIIMLKNIIAKDIDNKGFRTHFINTLFTKQLNANVEFPIQTTIFNFIKDNKDEEKIYKNRIVNYFMNGTKSNELETSKTSRFKQLYNFLYKIKFSIL